MITITEPVATRTWIPVCRLDDLEPGWGEAALIIDDHGVPAQVALFRLDDGNVYATSNTDPHTGAEVMARGIVGSRGDAPTIASPLHKEIYDLRTGAGLSDPGLALRSYPVRVIDGTIELGIG
ncbi:nitrite reductase small subunit NirD [Microlunatus sp. GCM10028923]|uniref:nitrite reductase small subunit NirD n=1 Tax=Microlunatus sp. GCM10028923 TaxID=3273400 RepID=UPI00360CDC9D